MIGAGDTFRAAAIEQLSELEQVLIVILSRRTQEQIRLRLSESVQKGIECDYDVVIYDTAGRLHTKKNLMEELKNGEGYSKIDSDAPHELFLVLDATTAKMLFSRREFLQAAELTGLIITKLDGTSKGGVYRNRKRI